MMSRPSLRIQLDAGLTGVQLDQPDAGGAIGSTNLLFPLGIRIEC
jgi:hypothetical protein